jgi:hypothetical protein
MIVEGTETVYTFTWQSPRHDPQLLFVVLQNKVHLKENLNFSIDGFSVYKILNEDIISQDTKFAKRLNKIFKIVSYLLRPKFSALGYTPPATPTLDYIIHFIHFEKFAKSTHSVSRDALWRGKFALLRLT